MGKPSAPAAPDPVATANAQGANNKETAIANAELNRVNQYSPYGSSEYSISGYNADGTPQYNQSISLSPSEQNLFNMGQQGAQTLGQTALNSLGNVQNQYSQNFNPGNFGANVQQAQDAAYKAQTQYLDPQFQRAGDSLNSQLANQGLQVGDAAYTNAQDQFGEQKQAAYQSAQNQAVSAGNQEQNTLFGQALTQYNQPLNTYNALMTGAQVQNPSFSSVPGVNQAGTNIAGITNDAYQNQLSAYNASNQGINNLFSLGGQLGAAAILA